MRDVVIVSAVRTAIGEFGKSLRKIPAVKLGAVVIKEVLERAGVDPKEVDEIFDIDERPREDTSLEKLAKLPPVFKNDGTVTAGNSPGINDGAAAVLLLSEEKARQIRVSPMAKIRASACVGVDPKFMGLAPVPAVRKVLKRAGLKLKGLDIIEGNEAFAAQSLVVIQELGINEEKLNLNGGAVALGHPIGSTGARILVTLLYLMRNKGASLGLATLCVGGGQGVATVIER